jgi:hypothetical protein
VRVNHVIGCREIGVEERTLAASPDSVVMSRITGVRHSNFFGTLQQGCRVLEYKFRDSQESARTTQCGTNHAGSQDYACGVTSFVPVIDADDSRRPLIVIPARLHLMRSLTPPVLSHSRHSGVRVCRYAFPKPIPCRTSRVRS